MKALSRDRENGSPSQTNLSQSGSVATRLIAPISEYVLRVQRKPSCACGGGCPQCRDKYPLQAKLEVSQPGDALEQEADLIAEQVMRMPEAEDPDHPEAQESAGLRASPYSSGASPQGSPEVPSSVHEVLASPGQPLSPATRAFMEPRFGRDFSNVRVHSGSTAAHSAHAVNALAYTVGERIVFGKQRYSPETLSGQRLLAHELTHTIQQDNAARSTSNRALDVNVHSPKKIARDAAPAAASTPEHSYWFHNKPPAKKIKTTIGEIDPKGQVVIQSATSTINSKDLGAPITVQFAGMDSDFRGGEPTKDLARAETLVLEAIRNVVKDLLELPARSYTWGDGVTESQAKKKMQTEVKHDETIRARLKEAMREATKRPLNIFIATELTVAEKISARPLGLSTQEIYVRPSEYGDPSKLQAAIRIPLVALLGGEVGLKRDGEQGFELTMARALTEEQSKEALLHEMMHVFMINRGASASKIWESVGPGMVKGPQAAKEACEGLMRAYLRAQDEVFVYSHVGELYSGFIKNKLGYEAFIQAVDLFLASISVTADQAKTIKLDVTEKVAKKKVDWQITYKYPKSVTVTEADVATLTELAKLDIGT